MVSRDPLKLAATPNNEDFVQPGKRRPDDKL
jgi:hypothetical protein